MRIASSTVDFSSTHVAAERSNRQESLRTWVGDRRPSFEAMERDGDGRGALSGGRDDASSDSVGRDDGRGHRALTANRLAGLVRRLEADAAAESQRSHHHKGHGTGDSAGATGGAKGDDDDGIDPKSKVIKLLVEAMTGKKIKVVSLDDVKQAQADGVSSSADGQQAAQQSQRAGWGVEYDLHETHDEVEQTSFNAQGVVKTADGKEITFTYELEMEREFHSETNVSVRAGDAKLKDPLVINFGGTAAQLTQQTYSFDLDADGTKDKVAWVQPNSGFLALDKNGNGKIDDGSELFGAKSGNGFAELAAYDDDHNGWIDENDAVYDRLRIWSKNGDADQLADLKARNVGAISLGQAATPFALKDAANQLQGAVRASGIYVKEDGSGVGSVQQVDLAV